MKSIKSIKEAKVEAQKIKSGVSDDTIFMAKCSVLFLEKLENVEKLLYEIKSSKKKVKRTPTDWQIFLGEYLRQGKTIQKASEDWKKQKIILEKKNE